MGDLKKTDSVFWIWPEETKPTKEDIVKNIWCAPCQAKSRTQACYLPFLQYQACLIFNNVKQKEPSVDQFSNEHILSLCGTEMDAMRKCFEHEYPKHQNNSDSSS